MLICGLDIGTSKIKFLIARENKEKKLEVIWNSEKESEGVRKGVVHNEEKTSAVLKNILREIPQPLRKQISGIYLSVNGSHLFSLPTKGFISVSRADGIISEEDVKRVINSAQNTPLPPNREMIDFVVKNFIIDDEIKVKDPHHLTGKKLEVEATIIAGFSPFLEKQKKVVLMNDLEIFDINVAPLAAARSVMSSKQKEIGTALIDMGAGTTGIVIFEEEELLHLAVLPVGANNITYDIAIGLKIETDLAEKIKVEFGDCTLKGKDVIHKIQLKDGEEFRFSQKFLVKIITERVAEIFSLVSEEIKKAKKDKKLPGGIILTGGGAKLLNIANFAKEKFHLPVKIGTPKGIDGLDPDPPFSVAAGLLLLAQDFAQERSSPFFQKLKNFFKFFIP